MEGSIQVRDASEDLRMQDAVGAPIRFARVDDGAIAWQRWGEGNADLVIVPPLAQNIELAWERPEYRRLFDRLGSFARVVHFDKRGTGASDRTSRMPTIDQRVEDLAAVMDAAGLERAPVVGISEGGPVAIAFAATYAERVESLALIASGARTIGDETDDEREGRQALVSYFHERWGTDRTVTLDVFGPSVAEDPDYRAWEARYERQSATPAALRELLDMIEAIDVRPLLGAVTCPMLIVHRRDDRIVPIAMARETAALVPTSRLVELDGDDHFVHTGDVDGWVDHLERFVVGSVSPPSRRRRERTVRIATMGGFDVVVDGEPVPASAWGSRQARLVCKRLAVAVDRPVPRDELADLLWPDELDQAKRSARLSVVLSNIRRVLGGGLVADREAVRLDLSHVDLDLVGVDAAAAGGDDAALVAAYAGPVLPEDAYEDWAISVRERVALSVGSARRRLAAAAEAERRWDDVVDHAHAVIELDPYDERAHESLVRALLSDGRRGEAQSAMDRYRDRMAELGIEPADLMRTPPAR